MTGAKSVTAELTLIHNTFYSVNSRLKTVGPPLCVRLYSVSAEFYCVE